MRFLRSLFGSTGDAPPDIKSLFEKELTSRGLKFSIDSESGRHEIAAGEGRFLVCLDNLRRDLQSDQDIGRISKFVDAIEHAAAAELSLPEAFAEQNLFWCLERSDYTDGPDFSIPVSDQLNKVLIHQSENGQLLTWVAPDILESLQIDLASADRKACENLRQVLQESKIEFQDIDGIKLGFINTPLAFKASLILASNLKEVAQRVLGWPLLAVVPDRSFLYLWDATHRDFCSRVGSVVVQEYSKSAYPLSTEVLEISDDGIRAIGEFPVS